MIAIATAIFTYSVFYGVALFFGVPNPYFIASVLIAAMIIHELCHLIAIEASGIPAQMFFLVVLGGAMPLLGYEKKYKELSWEKQAIIALVGVVGNFIAILAAFCLVQTSYLKFDDFLKIANLNGSLILWNLFPLWIFDGGRFTKLLFNSISEEEDAKYEMILLACFGVVVIALIFLGKLSFIHLWLFSWGLHWQSTHDDPHGSENPKAISKSHCVLLAAIFIIMISLGAIILSTTPNWI